MDGHLSNVQSLLKNEQKSDSFSAHCRQHSKSTTSRMYLRKCMAFKLLNHINMIRSMKSFTKPDYNIFMEKHIMILKTLRDKNVTLMNKHLDIYMSCQHKLTFRRFS